MTARVEAERAIADVLFKHRFGRATYTSGGQRLPDRCECWKFKGGVEAHRAHVASVLADLMVERQAEAWDEGHDHGRQWVTLNYSDSLAANPYRPAPKDKRMSDDLSARREARTLNAPKPDGEPAIVMHMDDDRIVFRDEAALKDYVDAASVAAQNRVTELSSELSLLRAAITALADEWEAAMGPRVLIDRDGTCDGCAEWKDQLVASYPLPDSEPWLCQECDDAGRREINDLRALLCPPTADTEGSDA